MLIWYGFGLEWKIFWKSRYWDYCDFGDSVMFSIGMRSLILFWICNWANRKCVNYLLILRGYTDLRLGQVGTRRTSISVAITCLAWTCKRPILEFCVNPVLIWFSFNVLEVEVGFDGLSRMIGYVCYVSGFFIVVSQNDPWGVVSEKSDCSFGYGNIMLDVVMRSGKPLMVCSKSVGPYALRLLYFDARCIISRNLSV